MKRRVDELSYLPAVAAALLSAALIGLARLVQLVDDSHDIDLDLDLDPQENPSS